MPRSEPTYCRAFGRRTGKPTRSKNARVPSSMRPLLGSTRRRVSTPIARPIRVLACRHRAVYRRRHVAGERELMLRGAVEWDPAHRRPTVQHLGIYIGTDRAGMLDRRIRLALAHVE